VSEWRWIGVNAVLAVHDRELVDYGGSDGVLSLDGLEGALGRPQNLAAYEEPDAADLAAAYAVGLARAPHAFVDANKRTAWDTARAFLRLNGFTLRFEKTSAVVLMVDIANDKIDQETVAAWFRDRLGRDRLVMLL
jgi:death-on-curing protein